MHIYLGPCNDMLNIILFREVMCKKFYIMKLWPGGQRWLLSRVGLISQNCTSSPPVGNVFKIGPVLQLAKTVPFCTLKIRRRKKMYFFVVVSIFHSNFIFLNDKHHDKGETPPVLWETGWDIRKVVVGSVMVAARVNRNTWNSKKN